MELLPGKTSREVQASTNLFEPLGFAIVSAGRFRSGGSGTVLIRTEDGVIARVSTHGAISSVPRILSVMSMVEDMLGALLTTSFAFDADLQPLDESLVQVFPFAAPAVLLAQHEEGLRLLEGEGLRFRKTEPAEIREVLALGRRRTASALLERTDEEILAYVNDRVEETHSAESMLGDPAFRERVQALRARLDTPAAGR